jgi:F-type H+-transporting ATPase subunit b
MNSVKRLIRFFTHLGMGVLLLHLLSMEAFAAENSSNWRPIYDTVMMWLNFGILAFVIIKFGRAPLKDFFDGRKKEIARQIEEVEEQKEEITARIKDSQKAMDEANIHFENLKKRIVEQGEKQKQNIIEEAQQQSRAILSDAHRRIENQFIQAKNELRAELIDAGIDLAFDRISNQITPEDNQKFLDRFLNSVSS